MDVEKTKKEATEVDDARRTSSNIQMLRQVRFFNFALAWTVQRHTKIIFVNVKHHRLLPQTLPPPPSNRRLQNWRQLFSALGKLDHFSMYENYIFWNELAYWRHVTVFNWFIETSDYAVRFCNAFPKLGWAYVFRGQGKRSGYKSAI